MLESTSAQNSSVCMTAGVRSLWWLHDVWWALMRGAAFYVLSHSHTQLTRENKAEAPPEKKDYHDVHGSRIKMRIIEYKKTFLPFA